jgi:hypothetical protein
MSKEIVAQKIGTGVTGVCPFCFQKARVSFNYGTAEVAACMHYLELSEVGSTDIMEFRQV